MSSTTGRPDDLKLGKILVQRGLATVQQVNECLALQAKSSPDKLGKRPRLGDLLIRQGYLSMEAIEDVLQVSTPAVSPAPHGLTPKTVNFNAVPDDAKAATLDPKRRMGKFALIKEIGRGGMGQVFKAWDTALNRLVAVKVLTADTTKDDIARFFREAQTAASLTHTHIAAVFDVGEQDAKYYIAMQYIDGKTLAGVKLQAKRAAEITKAVAEALEYAHREKLVHRDGKPQNIMVDKDGRPYILDFGLAKSSKGRSDVTAAGTVLGTPSYMAPEQAQGKPLTARNDVYSLGASLYEMLTGKPPFRGATAVETVMQVIQKELVPPSVLNKSVPPDIELIVLKSMDKDPRQRYPTMQAMADDLDRFLRGESVTAQPPSFSIKLKKLVKRNKALLPVAAALVIASVGVIAWMSSASGDAEAMRVNVEKARNAIKAADRKFADGAWQEALRLYSEAKGLEAGNAHAAKRIGECTAAIKAAEAKSLKEKEEAERKTREAEEKTRKRQAAAPEVSKGKELLDDAMRDLYRPGAKLEESRVKAIAAIERFDAALRLAPDLAEAFYYRGRAHQFRLDWAKAEADWGQALKADPKFVPALVDRGRYRMRRFSEIFIDSGGGGYLKDNVEANLLKAQAAEDFAAASKALTGDEQNAVEAMMRLAEGNSTAAVDLAERAVGRRGTDEELWKVLGDAYYFSSNVDAYQRTAGTQSLNIQKAVDAYTKAIELRTNFPEARAMRAYILEMAGQADAALADIETALKIDRRNFIALALGASIMGRKGEGPDPDRALKLYAEGIEVKPDSFFCRVNRAVVLVSKNRYDEAMADLDKAIELNPKHLFGYQIKGALLGKIGNGQIQREPERARKTFLLGVEALTKALDLSPDFATAWYNRGAVRASLASAQWDLGQAEASRATRADAVRDMEEAIRKGHPNPEAVRVQIRKLTGQ